MNLQVSEEVLPMAFIAAQTNAQALLAILGVVLVIAVLASASVMALLAEILFDTSILDEEPHEQETKTAQQGNSC